MAIVNVTYGHFGSGKLYSYYDPNGTHKAGDAVIVKVTHPKSKKIFKTLAVIRSTHAKGTVGDKSNRQYLRERDIRLKTITGGPQSQLSGYYKGWEKDAQSAYDLKMEVTKSDMPEMQKQGLFRVIQNMRNEDIEKNKKQKQLQTLPGMTPKNFTNVRNLTRRL